MNNLTREWNKKGASGLGRILNIIASLFIILLSLGIMYGYYALLPPHKAVLIQYVSTAQDGILLADMLHFPVNNEITIGDLIARREFVSAGLIVNAYLEEILNRRGYRLRVSDVNGEVIITARESEILTTHRDPWANSVVSVGILPQTNRPPLLVVLEVLE